MNRSNVAGALLLCSLLSFGSFSAVHAHPLAQACGNFNSRLAVGDTALVVSQALNIREAPGTNAARLRNPLEPGVIATITDGPRCVDGFTWWQVEADGTVGWVAEGNPNEYFLSAPVDPGAVSAPPGDFDTSGSANPNPPLSTLDGNPGGGNFYHACDSGFYDGVIGRSAYAGDNISNGGTVVYRPFTHVLEIDTPALCFIREVQYDFNGVAAAPNGQRIEPLVSQLFDDEEGDLYLTQIQLPPQAFLAAGIWRLEVPGYGISIDIRPPAHPYVLFTLADGGQMLVAGLQPNERFILSGASRGGNDPQWFEARANNRGIFTRSLRDLPWLRGFNDLNVNNLRASVGNVDIVGQMGSFLSVGGITITEPQTGYYWYRIPMRYGAPLMRELIWGGNYDEASAMDYLRQWTCPGAAPIRLDPDERVYVASGVGAQNVYSEPSLSAQVVDTIQPGDSVFIFYGVECADNGVWWPSDDGWIMESRNGQYLWTQ